MKRTLSIVLIFLALAHVAGFVPFYFYALEEIKTEVNLKLSTESNLQKVVVSTEEYNDVSVFKQEEENEFSFRGKMYDFKTVVKDGNNYVFYALADEKETTLISFLKNVFDHTSNSSKNKSPFSNLLKSFDKDFVGTTTPKFIAVVSTNTFVTVHFNQKTSEGYYSIPSSPPDFL